MRLRQSAPSVVVNGSCPDHGWGYPLAHERISLSSEVKLEHQLVYALFWMDQLISRANRFVDPQRLVFHDQGPDLGGNFLSTIWGVVVKSVEDLASIRILHSVKTIDYPGYNLFARQQLH